MSRLGRCWYLPDLQRTKLPFLPLFISPAFPECPLVLWGGFCGRPHKVGYCRLLLTSVVPPSAPLLRWPINLQRSDQNVSIDLNVQLSKTAHKSLKCKNEMKFPKEHPLNWQMDKKETKNIFDAKATQSHTNLCIQTSVCIPLLWDSVRRVKRLGRANAKEWDVKVRFPIH